MPGDFAFGGGVFFPTTDEDYLLLPIHIKLNRTNYHQWHRRVTIALKAADKFDYVNGKIKQPAATDPTHRDWVKSNATVLNWLLNTLTDPIVENIYRFDTAADVWAELEKSLGRPNPAQMVDLRNRIFNIEQGNLSARDYHSKFEGLWAEYCFYRPIPECSCDCEAVQAMQRHREEERVVSFLNGLNEKFISLRPMLLAQDPLPSVSDAFGKVTVRELRMEARRSGY